MAIAAAIMVIILALLVAVCEFFLHFALSSSVKNTDAESDEVFMSEGNQERRREAARFLEEKFTKVHITSREGLKLAARLYRNTSSHDWMITMHGYKADRLCNGQLYMHEASCGMNCLVIDVRGHGESEGKWLSMGLWESDDLARWVDYAVSLDSQANVFLHGVSMGGATVMMASGRNMATVKGIIEDCGYSSVYGEFRCQLKAMFNLPCHPILDLVGLWCRLRLGFSFSEVVPEREVAKTRIPMLFIHGDEDSFVPTSMVYECHEAHHGPKELWLSEGVGHAASMILHEEEYLQRVDAFIASCLSPESRHCGSCSS